LVALALISACLGVVRAEERRVEVAPGVVVFRRAFSGPINEQPFYGLAHKTDAERSADHAFVAEGRVLTG
jgi:hypothetical protein